MSRQSARLLAMGVFTVMATIYLTLWEYVADMRRMEAIPWLLLVVALPALIAGYLLGGRMLESARKHKPTFGLLVGMGVTVLAYAFCWVMELLLGGPLGPFHTELRGFDYFVRAILLGIPLCLLPAIPFGMIAGFVFYMIVRRRESPEGT
jgi:uncharacterized membrane protein